LEDVYLEQRFLGERSDGRRDGRGAGVLTEEEFQPKKAEIVARI